MNAGNRLEGQRRRFNQRARIAPTNMQENNQIFFSNDNKRRNEEAQQKSSGGDTISHPMAGQKEVLIGSHHNFFLFLKSHCSQVSFVFPEGFIGAVMVRN